MDDTTSPHIITYHKNKCTHTGVDFGLVLTDAGTLALYNATGAACSQLAPRGTALPASSDGKEGEDDHHQQQEPQQRLQLPLGEWTQLALVLGGRAAASAPGEGGGDCNVLVYRDGELVAAAATPNLSVRWRFLTALSYA